MFHNYQRPKILQDPSTANCTKVNADKLLAHCLQGQLQRQTVIIADFGAPWKLDNRKSVTYASVQ